MGTFSVIIYEAVNASRYCLLFTKVKVQIGDSKMGVEGLQVVSGTSQHSVMVISVYLFIELINCGPHQSPLDRKAGDNSAPLFCRGPITSYGSSGHESMSPAPEGEHHQELGDQLEINIADGSTAWAAAPESTLMDQLVSVFKLGAAPSHLLLVCHNETRTHRPRRDPTILHKPSLVSATPGKCEVSLINSVWPSTVLQAYCCFLKTIENERLVCLWGHYSGNRAAFESAQL